MQKGNLVKGCPLGSSVNLNTLSSNQLWEDLNIITMVSYYDFKE